MLAEIAERGASLAMLRGPAASRSPLLSRAARTASERRMCVLPLTPAPDADAGLPFAGLHRLLRPVLCRLDELPESCSERARGRVRPGGGSAAPRVPPRLAVLDLLAAAAADAPVVVIVDDMHSLDRPSADVLYIVARWLPPCHPVVVLLAGRAAQSRTLRGDDLEQLKLGSFVRPPFEPRPAFELALRHAAARGLA